LLFDKKPSDAHRFLGFVIPHRAASLGARIAMQSRMPDAERRYQPLMANVTSDAGLMMDRARYLRDTGLDHAARQLFASRTTSPGWSTMCSHPAQSSASNRSASATITRL
jgi:soluble lytic murein transglycosylase